MPKNGSISRFRFPHILALSVVGLIFSGGIAHAESAVVKPKLPQATCEKGQFCAWSAEGFQDQVERFDLMNANPEECISLSEGLEAHSFVNLLDRDITVYQGSDCSTEGDFTTYPGQGTYVPIAPYGVRAIQVWD